MWLRAFDASARSLSFTAAARDLNITQAAVSKHIRNLETHLGHLLFHRRARSLELTRMGEAYAPKVQDALERLAAGTREVFGKRRSEALTIRCAVSFAVNWLSPRLPGFMVSHPATRLRILSSVWSDAFDASAFDLDIQYGTGRWPGVTSRRLTQEAITPLCAPALARRLKQPDDLAGERLLHVLGYQEGWGVWLKAAGAAAVDPGSGLQLDTSLTAFDLAARGAGVALGRTSLSADLRKAGSLVAPFGLDLPIDEAFHVLVPQAPQAHPDAALFVAWLTEAAASEDAPAAIRK
jgi:LysR family transcriptional regulator, glycine cleavage system transcriptional activator